MRIIGCIVDDHNLAFVVLAALMCIAGSMVSTTLFRRTLIADGIARVHWCFLSAVTAGAATWATHFIAMLGYQPHAPVSLDGALTVVSALIAVGGIGLGLMLASVPMPRFAPLIGGATIGLALGAMHYVGMFAYRVDGIVHWDWRYVFASLVIAITCSIFAIRLLREDDARHRAWPAGISLVVAIVGLHFAGMAGFSVSAMDGYSRGPDSEAFAAMAAAIGMVGLLIIGTGISTYLLDRRTNSDGETRIAHIAMHDALTNLANRHQFTEALHDQCQLLEQDHSPFALMIVDLDRFKPINDTLGHPVGDQVLQRIASRLRTAVREEDMVARIGGDEFAVIAFDASDRDTITAIAERITEILSRPIVIQGNVVELSGSVGLALAPEHGTTPELLIQHADIALYSAKNNGRDTYRVFEPMLMETIKRRRSLEAALRRACMRDEFTLVYQPVFSSVNGKMTSAEALLRWTCPEHGEIPPSEFIPIAEELGLVSRIGADVLRQACSDAATWPDDIDLAVNVSPVQLLDPLLPQTVGQALADSGLAPGRLELEITETALLNNDEAALRTLTQIRKLGVRISLDDFGTGYSSLSYLHRFPISRIKIDKSFIQKLPDDSGSVSIVRAITQLGSSLSMKITAEGIETESQLAFIREQGCDEVQGFLTGRPIASAAFLAQTGRQADIVNA